MSRDRSQEPSRRTVLKLLAGAPGVYLVGCVTGRGSEELPGGYDWNRHYFAYLVDINKCIGCNSCMRACAAENGVPKGFFRTWVERYRISGDGTVRVDSATRGDFVFDPKAGRPNRAFFVPKICNHCARSVCTQVCPVGASYRTRDGVVLVDHARCIGCGYCVQACPYGTRFINPVTHTADKCTFCYHRITKGLPPACVAACPRGARLYGDLKDPKSRLSKLLQQRHHRTLRPELGTHPKCYYLGLDPEVI